MLDDDQEIALTPDELSSIRNSFPPNQLPLLCSFRSNIRYDKQSRPNSAVALSTHYIGLFAKDNQNSNFFTEKKLIHIQEIVNIYYSSKPFAVLETKKTKVTVSSKQSLHLAQLLYVIIKISYSYYPKQIEFIGDDDYFPPISFIPGKRDLFSPFISFPQQFQFTYYAECSACGVPYNHDVVRYINSMMLSANSIVDITQIPLDFTPTSQNKPNKIKSEQTIQKDDKKDSNADQRKDDKKSKDKNKKSKEKKSKEKKKNDKKSKDKKNPKNSKIETKPEKIEDKNDQPQDKEESDSSDIYENLDFSSIKNTELVPIFKSLQHLEFANGVCCRNFTCPDILKLLQQLICAGKDIHIIHIENCGVTDGLDYLAHAIKFNPELEISYWNLSYNQFDDFNPFIMIINFSKGNLLYLNLNYCNISSTDASELFTSLWRNPMMHNLKYLFIAGMNFVSEKGEVQIGSFEKYISRNGNIEILDISEIKSEAASEILSVFTDKPNKIKTLIVKNVDFSSSKKSCFEQLISFLMKTETLETLDISNTNLDPHQVEMIISTIAKNVGSRKSSVSPQFNLNLGKLNLNGKNILILYRAFLETDMNIWNSLSFDENEMNVGDLKNLVPLLARMKNLNSLSISGNFDSKMVEIEFVLPLVLKIPSLTALYVAGNKNHRLKSKISVLLDKIYKMDKLTVLDISENGSYECLNGISHILHSCQNMKQLFVDGNDFNSIEQFENLTSALSDNKTVISAPFPINDVQNFIKSCTIEKVKQEEKLKEKEEDKKEGENEEDKKDKKNKKSKKEKKSKKNKKKNDKHKKSSEKANKDNDQKPSEIEIDIDIEIDRETYNEQNIKDFIKILSELQVTAITAVNANRINQKLPNDLPFPATDEIQSMIQSISSKTRINIKRKNLNNHSCITELLSLPLPFQNTGDVARNGGNVRTINIGQLKRYKIKAMESVIENKKPIDKMNTMVLPTTMLLHFNTQFLNKESGSESESESTTEDDSDSDSEDESSSEKGDKRRNSEQDGSDRQAKKKPRRRKTTNRKDTSENESESDSIQKKNQKSRKKPIRDNRKDSSDGGSDDSSDNQPKRRQTNRKSIDSSDSDDRAAKRRRNKQPRRSEEDDDYDEGETVRNKKRGTDKYALKKSKRDADSYSEDDRIIKRRRKPPSRHRNSSSESETDSDPYSDVSSSVGAIRRKPKKKSNRRSQNYSSEDDDEEYVVRRKNSRKPSRRYESSDDDDVIESSESEDVMPWKNRLRTKHGSDSGLDKLVDTTYNEARPKRKGNGRGTGGYAAGYFDEETLDSFDINKNQRSNRNNRNDQNYSKSKRKPAVTFNLS